MSNNKSKNHKKNKKVTKEEDYYAMLGVDRDATEKEIKRAFRKMAVKMHPDKHNKNRDEAEQKFKKITEAHRILTDDYLKEIYDEYGSKGLEEEKDPFREKRDVVVDKSDAKKKSKHFDVMKVNFNEMLKKAFQNDMEGRGFSLEKDRSIIFPLECTLEELYTGMIKKYQIDRRIYDTQGRYREEAKVLTITILPGWKEDTKITYEELGNSHPDKYPGDVIFIIKEMTHKRFIRDGHDLIITKRIKYSDMKDELNLRVRRLDRSVLNVTVYSVPSSDYVHIVKGEGMPIRRGGIVIGYGCLRIKFIIIFDI